MTTPGKHSTYCAPGTVLSALALRGRLGTGPGQHDQSLHRTARDPTRGLPVGGQAGLRKPGAFPWSQAPQPCPQVLEKPPGQLLAPQPQVLRLLPRGTFTKLHGDPEG